MKSWWTKVIGLLGVLSLIVFSLRAVVEYQYEKDESRIGLELSYNCLAIGIIETLNEYYIDHKRYPDEKLWTYVVIDAKSLSELGCGPHENDTSFLDEGFIYELANKDEASLYLKNFSNIEKSNFMLKLGKLKE